MIQGFSTLFRDDIINFFLLHLWFPTALNIFLSFPNNAHIQEFIFKYIFALPDRRVTLWFLIMPFLENALELILHEPKSTHFKLTCILVSFDFPLKRQERLGPPPPRLLIKELIHSYSNLGTQICLEISLEKSTHIN